MTTKVRCLIMVNILIINMPEDLSHSGLPNQKVKFRQIGEIFNHLKNIPHKRLKSLPYYISIVSHLGIRLFNETLTISKYEFKKRFCQKNSVGWRGFNDAS